MIKRLFESLGEITLFGLKAVRDFFRAPLETEELIEQFYDIGVCSAPLIVVSGIAMGIVMTLHTRSTLIQFGAEAQSPTFQSMAFFNEIGPLLASLLVAGRVGGGIGAQLATMRATEQIDAIEALSIDSFKLLVSTRVAACTLMLPLLTLLVDASGILGGYLTEHWSSALNWQLYCSRAFDGMMLENFIPPTAKTAVFGYLIGTISSYFGFTTNQGSEGVRRASTRSVVISSFAIILSDVILVKLIFVMFPEYAV